MTTSDLSFCFRYFLLLLFVCVFGCFFVCFLFVCFNCFLVCLKANTEASLAGLGEN